MEAPEKTDSAKIYIAPLLAGGVAGVTVCTGLYPLDTLKTRLQSQHGFHKSGGFRGVYQGYFIVAAASMPVTALFFMSYEATKSVALPLAPPQYHPLVHMLAASISEVISCSIRVPIEMAKQRKQTYMGSDRRSSIKILVEAYKSEGLCKGVYRGFLSTVARDLPFSFIEMPLWEGLKSLVRERNDGKINGFQSAACGAVAGSVAAAATMPLDVAKTRVMLATHALGLRPALAHVYVRAGLRGLFSGFAPRVATVGLGSFLFFGVYEHVKISVEDRLG